MRLLIVVISLIRSFDFGGLPYDAAIPGVAYSTSSNFEFPNFDNPSVFSIKNDEGISLSFGYAPHGWEDILNYGSQAKFRNLTAISFYMKGGGFSYRPLGKKKIISEDFQEEYSIDEFQIVLSDLVYYKFYGGIGLKYYYVRYSEASVENGSPHVNLDTGNGFSINVGALLDFDKVRLGFFLRNILSGIYYHDYPKDVLNLSGGSGIAVVPHNAVMISLDCIGEKEGKLVWTSGLTLKPLKWLAILTGYSFSDRCLSGGVQINYKEGNFVITYRKDAVFLTWRSSLK
ncbi:MAG: hypothetical protein WBI96_05630 [Candidatus Hydrothermia bacterium]